MAPVELTSGLTQKIRSQALTLGFDRVGFSRAPSLSVFPTARTIISLGIGYFSEPLPPKPGPGYGRVARYAWGLDYHAVIRPRLEKLAEYMTSELGLGGILKYGTDSMPILEKPAAQAAGLGFIGKNSILIVPRMGSWIFLADIILESSFMDDEEISSRGPGCGACCACQEKCPTNALAQEYSLNQKRCISFLTIENKGEIPLEFRKNLGDWIFGCDFCQDACPFNSKTTDSHWPEFAADRGPGPWIRLEEILTIPDQKTFKGKWGETSLMRAKRKGLVRNACVAAGNSGDKSLIPALENLLNDSEPLIKDHALWAMNQLGVH